MPIPFHGPLTSVNLLTTGLSPVPVGKCDTVSDLKVVVDQGDLYFLVQ